MWLELLSVVAIPFVVVIATIGFTWFQGKQQRKTEEQRAQDAALQAYLDEMGQLLLETDLSDPAEGSTAPTVAQARTSTVLSRLDQKRKGEVIRFLVNAKLVQSQDPMVKCKYLYRDPNEEPPQYPRFRIINLIGTDLNDASLNLVYMAYIDLSNTYLSDADLSRSGLCNANLSGADLSNADLRVADLSNANLTNSKLSGTHLSCVDLSDVEPSDVDLSDVDLSDLARSCVILTDDDRQTCIERRSDDGLSCTDLRGANLSSADLTGAHLRNAGLSCIKLSDDDLALECTDLRRAALTDADLSGADLAGADLRGADLSCYELPDDKTCGILSVADLTDANFTDANLSGANLTGAIGITNEELCRQTNLLEGATMPDGKKFEDCPKEQ